MKPRIYTYKITFEEVPYYYYGVKKEKHFNEEYWGSPYTNKWCWELYTPKKQILEVFEYSDDGYIIAQEVEKRLISPVLNDDWCLNENVGGIVSLSTIRNNLGKKRTEETKKKISESLKGRYISEEHRRKISETKKNNPYFSILCKTNAEKRKGISLTEAHKEKLSKSGIGKNKGHLNGNYGKHWYTDGVNNIMSFECPIGFHKGKTSKS
jgi:hypothetical protein